MATTEWEWAERAARHLKAETKRASVTYEALADRLNSRGFEETKASIANKLARATMPAAFFLAYLAALGVRLDELWVKAKPLQRQVCRLRTTAI